MFCLIFLLLINNAALAVSTLLSLSTQKAYFIYFSRIYCKLLQIIVSAKCLVLYAVEVNCKLDA